MFCGYQRRTPSENAGRFPAALRAELLRFSRRSRSRAGAAVVAFVPVIMLLHDLRKFLALIGRQFAANFLPHFPEFLSDLFADFVPHPFHSLLAVADNGLN